jgi:hypothetical protein
LKSTAPTPDISKEENWVKLTEAFSTTQAGDKAQDIPCVSVFGRTTYV